MTAAAALGSSSKVALVTGGGKRIGKAIVYALHTAGYDIAVHYHSSQADAADVVLDLCRRRASSAIALRASLSDEVTKTSKQQTRVALTSLQLTLRSDEEECLAQRCCELVSATVRCFGRIDVLVNSASSFFPTEYLNESQKPSAGDDADDGSDAQPALLWQRLHSDWNRLMGSNAKAPWLLCKAFAEANRRSDDVQCGDTGRNLSIVNVTDSMLSRPLQDHSVYVMAKHALHGLTLSAAVELAPLGIRVNAVAPGHNIFPDSDVLPMTVIESMRQAIPLGQREGTPEEVAAAVLFLVSPQASYITGQTLGVDGGLSLKR